MRREATRASDEGLCESLAVGIPVIKLLVIKVLIIKLDVSKVLKLDMTIHN